MRGIPRKPGDADWISVHETYLARADVLPPLLAEVEANAHRQGQDSVREAILQPHVRKSTDQGPDYCATCSEAITEWVPWPCAAVAEVEANARAEVDEAV